jgi:hypothetical protein
VEEVLDAAFVPDESETLVDQEASNCPGWHNPTPSVPNPQGHPKGTQPGAFVEGLSPWRRESGRVIQP